MKLLVVLPFCSADLDQASRLLDWIEELGRLPENDCLLVQDCRLAKASGETLLEKAKGIFKSAKLIATPSPLKNEGWPMGPNWMFETTVYHVSRNGQSPFIWLEPDSVPMRASWLAEIEREYFKAGKPYLGHIVKPGKPDLPESMMWGVGVYPGDLAHAKRLLRMVLWAKTQKPPKPWDVAGAGEIVKECKPSDLIYCFHGLLKLPPTFAVRKEPGQPVNTMEVKKIPAAAALFHRCKDPSLITILRGDGGPTIPQLLMAFTHNLEIAKSPPVLEVEEEAPLYIHCVERHPQSTVEQEKRILKAVRSWIRIYKTGEMIPCHLWNYPRSSAAIGDTRNLPYLKDVLAEGMTKARRESDIIVLTNDDTILHPQITQVLREKLRDLQCCGSFRVNFDSVDEKFYEVQPEKLAAAGKPDLGRDLFAFRKSWLKKRWHQIPDYFLGEYEWDLTVTAMIRHEAGIYTTKVNLSQFQATEIPRGYVLHEMHPRQWVSKAFQSSPAKRWNRELALRYYASNNLPSMIANI